MNVEKKIFDSKAAVEDGDKGIVHLIASVFGNVDSDGDIMVKGAFARTIDVGKGKGKLPPGVWGHDWTLPVAKTVDAYEDENGLNVLAQFNLGTQRGRESFSDIKEGLITEYSFGFKVLDSEKKDGSRLIKDVEWFEWSPVLVGANRETSTVSVKQSSGKQTDEAKAIYLGEYCEAEMTSAALRSLNDALFYNVIWSIFYNDKITNEERIAQATAAIGEFGEIATRTISQFLQSASAESLGETAKQMKQLWPREGEMTLEDESLHVFSVIEGFKSRLTALKATRAKQGRVLSTTNRNRLAGHREALMSVCDDLGALMDETDPEPKASSQEIHQALVQYQAITAQGLGVNV